MQRDSAFKVKRGLESQSQSRSRSRSCSRTPSASPSVSGSDSGAGLSPGRASSAAAATSRKRHMQTASSCAAPSKDSQTRHDQQPQGALSRQASSTPFSLEPTNAALAAILSRAGTIRSSNDLNRHHPRHPSGGSSSTSEISATTDVLLRQIHDAFQQQRKLLLERDGIEPRDPPRSTAAINADLISEVHRSSSIRQTLGPEYKTLVDEVKHMVFPPVGRGEGQRNS